LETSLGNLWFTGNVVGPFKINYNGNGACDYSTWATAADAAAQAAGVDLSLYAHKVYVFPKANGCGWAGLGTIGGNPSRAWIATCDLADVYAHELGHNLGMHHASTDADNDDVSDCEYCDNSDFKVYGRLDYGLNGRIRRNGLAANQQGSDRRGKWCVHGAPPRNYGQRLPYPQTLKIEARYDDFYYFSLPRRALGYDVNMPASYASQMSVHHWRRGTEQTFLIRRQRQAANLRIRPVTWLRFGFPTTAICGADISYGCTHAARWLRLLHN
jgi:hypothetical protein